MAFVYMVSRVKAINSRYPNLQSYPVLETDCPIHCGFGFRLCAAQCVVRFAALKVGPELRAHLLLAISSSATATAPSISEWILILRS